MLDVESVKRIDAKNMIGIASGYAEQIDECVKLAGSLKVKKFRPKNIVVAGMGGSAIGGDILAAWLPTKSDISVYVNREYNLPKFVDKNTLFFAVSYSGNTEETLSATKEAKKMGARIIGIASGGGLIDFCKKSKLPYIQIKSGIPPRSAIIYLFFPMLVILEKMGLISAKRDIVDARKLLAQLSNELAPITEVNTNIAKKIAIDIKDTIPIVYGWMHYSAISKRWRTQLNENSKIIARDDNFPEMNHNDTVGWSGDYDTKRFSVILLRDAKEPERIRTRIELTKKLVLNNAKVVVEIWPKGETILGRMFYSMYIGDLVSIYLAVLRGIDPMPVDVITRLKNELQEVKK